MRQQSATARRKRCSCVGFEPAAHPLPRHQAVCGDDEHLTSHESSEMLHVASAVAASHLPPLCIQFFLPHSQIGTLWQKRSNNIVLGDVTILGEWTTLRVQEVIIRPSSHVTRRL